MIDYIIVEEGLAGDIKRTAEGGQVDSDHHPVGVWIRGGGEEGEKGKERRGRGGRGCWDKVGREEFRKGMREWESGGGEMQEEIEKMSRRIRELLAKTEEGGKEKRKKGREWWDEECRQKKSKVRRALRE